MQYSTFLFIIIYQNVIALGMMFLVYLFAKFARLKSKIAVNIAWGIMTVWALILLAESIYISYIIPGG